MSVSVYTMQMVCDDAVVLHSVGTVPYIPCSSKKSMHCLKTVGSSSWSVPSVLRWMATSTVTPNTAESVGREGEVGGGRRKRREGKERRGEGRRGEGRKGVKKVCGRGTKRQRSRVEHERQKGK